MLLVPKALKTCTYQYPKELNNTTSTKEKLSDKKSSITHNKEQIIKMN